MRIVRKQDLGAKMLKLNAEVKRCMKCGKNNTFLTQADIHEYGVWIARNQNCSCYSRVQLIDNPVFDEFLDLIRTTCSEHNIADYKKYLQPSITHDIFPIACDQVDGDHVSFRDCPRVCRYCGSKEFAHGLSEPLYSMEVNTFEVTYDSWNLKTKEEKKQLIYNALRVYE